MLDYSIYKVPNLFNSFKSNSSAISEQSNQTKDLLVVELTTSVEGNVLGVLQDCAISPISAKATTKTLSLQSIKHANLKAL